LNPSTYPTHLLSLKFTATFIFVSVMAMARANIIAWGRDHCNVAAKAPTLPATVNAAALVAVTRLQ
jgi:hypothetical protein